MAGLNILTLGSGKSYANMVALGISNMRVSGTTVYFTVAATGEEVSVTLPAPADGKDGISIANVEVNANKELIVTLSDNTKVNAGVIPTVKGDKGNPGENGKSAYELAVDNGFVGTETEWLESLKGADGQGGEENIIESIKVNGVTQTVSADKSVDITVPDTYGDINTLQNEITDIMSYIGYTDADIYGVEVDFKNKKFTRLAGAVGKTPGESFDSVKAFGGRKRCNVTDAGKVVAYYGDAGFSTTGKLTQAVTVGEGDAAVTYASGTIVQVMVEQPKFYYKVVPLLVEKKAKGSITRKIRYYVSDTAKAGFKLHPAFIVNGQENEKIYVSAFEGSLWDASASTYILDDSQVADFTADMLSSIANAKPMSGLTQNLVRSNVRKLAEKRGTGWEQATVQTAAASELLMLIEYASFNMQSAIGQGAVNKTDDGSSNMAENTGVTITLGNASGTASNANGVQFVTYRGEENFWGNIWGWVDGLNQYFDAANKTSTIYIADHGFTDDINAAPYEDAGIIPSLTNGYVSAFCYSEDYDWLFIAGEVLGDSSLPVGDYFWQITTTGWRVAILGARWFDGLAAGAFYWYLDYASSTRARGIGGRLVYRKKVVSAI